ncbi:MAG: pseudouridine synthase [Burkholderiales bacterium]|nr:pseudouridine synthase [Burkholderiales bacterium]
MATASKSSKPGRRGKPRSTPKIARSSRRPLRPPTKHASKQVAEDSVSKALPVPKSQKLQKVLAQSGLGSRRAMEELIKDGKVKVNDDIAVLGQRVTTEDLIQVGRRRIQFKITTRLPRVILYHKPEGEIVSREDPKERASVFEKLPAIRNAKWLAIGRLDFNTCGLLIFTTSGELANRLMHPRFEVEREYAVRIYGVLSKDEMAKLAKGVRLSDGMAKFESIEPQGGEGRNHWYRVIVKEGRNRLVRRMFEALGYRVSRLMRVRFGIVSLPPSLKRSTCVELKETEIRSLLDWVGSVPPAVLPYREPARKSPAVSKKTKSGPARVSSQTKGSSG